MEMELETTKMFVLHWTAPDGEDPATIEIEEMDSLPDDTGADIYFLIGRATITDDAMEISQDHIAGVALMWWLLTCGEAGA